MTVTASMQRSGAPTSGKPAIAAPVVHVIGSSHRSANGKVCPHCSEVDAFDTDGKTCTKCGVVQEWLDQPELREEGAAAGAMLQYFAAALCIMLQYLTGRCRGVRRGLHQHRHLPERQG